MPAYLLSHVWNWLNADTELGIHTLTIDSPNTDQADVAAAAAATFNANPPMSGLNMAGAADYVQLRCAEITDLLDGTLAPASVAPLTVQGTGGTPVPPQCAIAVSLTAGPRPNGTPIKGRFYLPPPQATNIGTDGRLTTTEQTRLKTAITAWFNALIDAAMFPMVWSRTIRGVSPVNTVRVGRVVDTIRSRRNQLQEDYGASISLPPPP